MRTTAELAGAIRAGDRRALAQGITLVESTRADHRQQAEELLDELLDATGEAIRVGISGAPGVGKSTFIEALGMHLMARGHRLAVLAVDPSSSLSGGSVLGDKTRMGELARAPQAFIRPSPGGGELGGVARRSREALLLCEAAGHDVIFVETIGVGQSEVAVSELVDAFVLLVSPAGGDELQGIKRGIMELADLVVVNKADGDLAAAAARAEADHRSAVSLLRRRWRGWEPEVIACSATEGTGIDTVWSALQRFWAAVNPSGELAAHRAGQAVAWMWSEIDSALRDRFRARPQVSEGLAEVEAAVAGGRISPAAAARELLSRG